MDKAASENARPESPALRKRHGSSNHMATPARTLGQEPEPGTEPEPKIKPGSELNIKQGPDRVTSPEPAGKPCRSQQRKTVPYMQAQVVHYRPRVSVLDKELTTVSYHGLVNFLLLLLSATLIRMAIENYLKYGILLSIPGTGIALQDWLVTLAGVLVVLTGLLVAFAIEKSAIPARPKPGSRQASSGKNRALLESAGVGADEKRTLLLHAANLGLVLVVPSCVTYFGIFQPALGTLVMALACVMFLKLYSLVATNFDLRRAYRLGDARLDSDPLR
ncbi:hypothetical protein GGF43_006231, partial [Coemansia sp. RSA 2618]